MKHQPRYDYPGHRWRLITRTSTKHGIAEDTDGNRCKLSDLQLTAEQNYEAIHDDWKLLGAIACHAKTPEDYADAREMLTYLPADLRPVLWRSFPAEVQNGLRHANANAAQPAQEAQEGGLVGFREEFIVRPQNKLLDEAASDVEHSLSGVQQGEEFTQKRKTMLVKQQNLLEQTIR